MFRLLVIQPTGEQKLITIGEGGKYFDSSLVHWDERIDGPFPDGQIGDVGKLKRSGNDLVIDAAIETAHNAALAAQQASSAVVQARLDNMNTVGAANSIVALRGIVQDILKHLGLIP